jgi:hypothetical protein
MTPAEFLKHTKQMAEQLEAMKRRAVFVGLPAEKVGGRVYGDGMTVLQIGAIHEYGMGPNPVRSFLRVPFATKRKEINEAIAKQFEAVSNGRDVEQGLGLVGVACAQISKGAFTSLGYGDWEPIKAETAARKGSSQTLIDTGILRSSVTWVIR